MAARMPIWALVLSSLWVVSDSMASEKASPQGREWKGKNTAIQDERYVVVGDDTAWAKLWKQHRSNEEKPPAIDFCREMVIAVFNPAWTKTGFRIDRVMRGNLTSNLFFWNVFLVSDEFENRFHLKVVSPTRFAFRFYAQGKALNVEDAGRIATRDSPYAIRKESIEPALRKKIEDLIEDLRKGNDSAIDPLKACGEPARTYLYAVQERKFIYDAMRLLKDLARRAAQDAPPIIFSEVALEKAKAHVLRSFSHKGTPWFISQDAIRLSDTWHIRLTGTFSISNTWEIAHQKDVSARLRINALTARISDVSIDRDKKDIEKLIAQSSPGVKKVK